ncbi:NEDD8 [Babesia bovis T2Bo]|uniref:NEDD8 n=1 Tax=Babesia bovis T2Bo TaxID=484906 RepID=UPI001C35FD0B|nr:NEDD8 [Babesia bovis T2Bo]EDO06583.2 NEDD8 [Babesia bovis T2Bo]
MQVLIKTLSGQRVPFDFEPGDTIAQVKRSIHENEPSFDLRQMRLIYSGRHLSDELTLRDYKVIPGSTIHMVLQLRGG